MHLIDNLCLTNTSINSPSSKCNAKLQRAVHERWITILVYRASRAARSIIVQSRAVDCHGAGLQVAPETHRRHSWDPIEWIDYVLLFSYGTDGFHLDLQKDSKAKSVTGMEYYCWRLMQSDGRA